VHRVLQLLLRIAGTSMLFALVFVAAPRSWMQDIHGLVELGEMPNTPIVWYLARSVSAFYAVMGGLFWIVSFNVSHHHSVLSYLGWTMTVFGAALCVIDVQAAMPLAWTVTEGPFVTLFGVVMLYLVSRCEHSSVPDSAVHPPA
jgi:hypothetical protein